MLSLLGNGVFIAVAIHFATQPTWSLSDLAAAGFIFAVVVYEVRSRFETVSHQH